MRRNIYTVNAKQVVISQANPQGLLSDVDGFPKDYDSRSYKATTDNPNGNEEIALVAAQAEYWKEILALMTADSQTRVAWSVSVTRASDDKQLFVRSEGAFPDMTPQPEPEPNAEPAQE